MDSGIHNTKKPFRIHESGMHHNTKKPFQIHESGMHHNTKYNFGFINP